MLPLDLSGVRFWLLIAAIVLHSTMEQAFDS